MECSDCRFLNPPSASFCGKCGARLSRTLVCAECGEQNPIAHAYCHGCGNKLAPEPAVAQPSERLIAGERRQLTALFCDLVGFTSLSCKLDIEDLREVMNAYYQACAQVISRLDGHVAQHLGDGLLIYFGYPRAHDDDAVRGVNAALAITEALAEVEQRSFEHVAELTEHPLSVRIGIHTGEVVVGDAGDGTGEQVTLGTTLNIASRLQSIADPDTILITHATARLVQGLFVLEPLGERELRGVDHPVAAYRVVRPSGVVSRLDLAATTGLTPFVDRAHELGLLLDRWEQAADGMGQAVLITGDAGVGKSRLVRRLRDRLAAKPHTWIEGRGSPYHSGTAFHPIIGLIQHGIGLETDDAAPVRIEKLENAIASVSLVPGEVLPLFASLLSLPLPDRYPPAAESAQARRRRTLDALVAWICSLAQRDPVTVVMEDLHWVDPSTLELLTILAGQASSARVLVLLTARSEYQATWPAQTHGSHLKLNPLTRQYAREMVVSLFAETVLHEDVVGQLVTKCDGVPLYVEELTKAVIETELTAAVAGTTAGVVAPALAIPTTLQDSLMARLDRLGPAKEVAQLASVLGREFPHDLLAALVPLAEAPLRDAIDALTKAELLYRRGLPPRATYMFKHALIQDTAYASLLRTRRIELHSRVARVLEDRFPELVQVEPELIAYHYARAHRHEAAAAYYRRAGELAKERMANLEAIEHLKHAIELLTKTPPSDARDREELRLQVALGAPLIATGGYAHAEVGKAFERAHELCGVGGDTSELFEAVYGLSAYCLNRTDMARAHELSQRLLDLGQRIPPPSRLPWAHQQMGCVYFFGGDPTRAREHFDQAVAGSDDVGQRPFVNVFGQDAATACTAMSAMNLWLLGFPDASLAAGERALARAHDVRHPFTLAFALNFIGYTYVLRSEPGRARPIAEELERLAREQALSQWTSLALVLRGWAADDPDEGIAGILAGMTVAQAVGSRIGSPFQVGMLAERQLAAGRFDDALQTVSLALALAHETHNHFRDPELHRLRGDIELGRSGGRAEDAESYYQRALEVARAQRARGPELRAAVSAARLKAERGDRNTARELLAPVYSSFTEGLETVDLRAAATLLAELA